MACKRVCLIRVLLVVIDVCCFIPDFTLGTVHKAKGLEFDTVIISDDFIKVPTSRHNMHFSPEFSFGWFLWTDLFFDIVAFW